MIAQHVYLPCNWKVDIYYDVNPPNAEHIIDRLYALGCERSHLFKAKRILQSGLPNQGLTYSNYIRRKSIIVVGHVTSPLELCNTLLHECDHLQVAICKADGYRTDGEDAAYIMGDITEAIARNAWQTMRKIFLYLL